MPDSILKYWNNYNKRKKIPETGCGTNSVICLFLYYDLILF